MNWGDYFMGLAWKVAEKSKDPNTHVGAVLVDEDQTIRVTGYNGLPRGVRDLEQRLQRPTKYAFVSHAEMNCIAQAARVGVSTKGCTLFVTHAPCSMCARLIIQAGITRVVAGGGGTSMPEEEFVVASQMFDEAGVQVMQLTGDQKQ